MTGKSKIPHRSAFAVIQAPILYNVELNDGEKIIYGHIANLCNECGYCYATNGYLAEVTGKSVAAIKRAIRKLMDLNFIEIAHVLKGRQDERQITLSNFSKSKEIQIQKGDGSKMSHPQLKNDLPGGSKMSHRIIKEEYTNKNTTTPNEAPTKSSKHHPNDSSSSFKCKNKLQKLEDLPISSIQKQKIYRDFEEKHIVNGLEWLESVEARDNPAGALYDAIKHGYKPKISKEKLAVEHKNYAKEKLIKYDSQTVRGYKVDLCKGYVEFSATSGISRYFEYAHSNFKAHLDAFCARLGIS